MALSFDLRIISPLKLESGAGDRALHVTAPLHPRDLPLKLIQRPSGEGSRSPWG
jgi:hypothetical protein